jgi:hypothetical protein
MSSVEASTLLHFSFVSNRCGSENSFRFLAHYYENKRTSPAWRRLTLMTNKSVMNPGNA